MPKNSFAICPILPLAALLFFSLTAAAQNAAPENEFQIWNETTLAVPLIKQKDDAGKETERLTLVLFGVLRLGQNRLVPVDERIGAGVDLKLNNNFTFSPSYLYAVAQPSRGRTEYEHRARFDLSYEKKWKPFSIKDRNRVEYRIRHSRSDSVRYRNKLTLNIPVNREGKTLFTPFVADEVYYDLTAKSWSRNELSGGITKKLSSVLTADFFYLWRHNTSGQLRNVHAIGTNLKFKIK